MRKAIGPFVSLLVLGLAACASASNSAPAGPAPLNPVGYYEFSTDVEGQLVTGAIEIRRVDGGGYGGVVTTSATEPLPLQSVVVDGQKLTIAGDTPDGMVSMTITFTGEVFTGSWTYAGMSGTMSGKRIR